MLGDDLNCAAVRDVHDAAANSLPVEETTRSDRLGMHCGHCGRRIPTSWENIGERVNASSSRSRHVNGLWISANLHSKLALGYETPAGRLSSSRSRFAQYAESDTCVR
jgi:hypothetical protein